LPDWLVFVWQAPQGCGQVIGGFLAAHGIEQPENAHLYENYL